MPTGQSVPRSSTDASAARADHGPLDACRRSQRERDFDAALVHLDAVLEVRPADMALRIRRGALLRSARRIDESIAYLEALLEVEPDNRQAMIELANSLRQAGLLDRSAALVDKLLGRRAGHRGAMRARIEIAMQQHAPERGFALLEAAIVADPDDLGLKIRHGALLRQARQVKESLSLLASLRRAEPANLQVAHELAVSLLHAGRVAESSRIIEGILARDATHRGALLSQVDIATQQYLNDDALTRLDAALALYPADLALRVRRIVLLRKLGRPVEALSSLPELGDHPLVRQERIATLLELAEVDKAVAESAALAAAEPLNPAAQVLWLKALRESGDPGKAIRLGERLAGRWPYSAEIAVQRATCLLWEDNPETAIAVLDSLPEGAKGIGSVAILRANALLKMENFKASDALFVGLQERGGLNLAAIGGRLRVALAHGWEGPHFRETLDQVRSLIGRHAATSGHGNVERLFAEVAAQVGDWQALLTLTEGLRSQQPRDAMLQFLEARAAFETGDADRARRVVADFLNGHPAYRPALVLREELTLAAGDVALYLDQRQHRLSWQKPYSSDLHSDIVRDLFMLGRTDDPLGHGTPTHGAAGQDQGFTGDKDGPDAGDPIVPARAARVRPYGILSSEELRDLLDFGSREDLAGPTSFTAAEIAWRLCDDRPESFAIWRARAARATYALHKMARHPYVTGRLPDLVAPVDIGPLGPLVADGRPFLMCSTHFGPRTFDALDPLLPSAVYLVQHEHLTPVPGEMAGGVISVSRDHSRTAVAMYKALREGHCLMSSPDYPVGLLRGGRQEGAACGRIFDVPCAIVDTVPKLSQGMKIPSFWVQSRWRGARIDLEIEPLPMARENEASQSWCDRWAQAYLDKVAAIMRSRPENQNLKAPMWRYLLLRGLGNPAVLAAGLQGDPACDRPTGMENAARSSL